MQSQFNKQDLRNIIHYINNRTRNPITLTAPQLDKIKKGKELIKKNADRQNAINQIYLDLSFNGSFKFPTVIILMLSLFKTQESQAAIYKVTAKTIQRWEDQFLNEFNNRLKEV